MKINELCKESHETARAKGWYSEGDRNTGELIALIHSELSEALEHSRHCSKDTLKEVFYDTSGKPDGFAIEIADTIIRIADLCGYLGIDLEEAIRIKTEYNKTRANRHGGKIF